MTVQNDQSTSNPPIPKHVVTGNLQNRVFQSPLNKLTADNNKKHFVYPISLPLYAIHLLNGIIPGDVSRSVTMRPVISVVGKGWYLKIIIWNWCATRYKQTSLIPGTNHCNSNLARFRLSLVIGFVLLLIAVKMIRHTPKLTLSHCQIISIPSLTIRCIMRWRPLMQVKGKTTCVMMAMASKRGWTISFDILLLYTTIINKYLFDTLTQSLLETLLTITCPTHSLTHSLTN